MIDKSEINRLNRVGADVAELKLNKWTQEYYRFGIFYCLFYDWSPATDLTHNAMVMDHFDNWEVYKMKGYNRKGRLYTCTIWTDTGKWFIGQADTEALARAKAYEKAWEMEKEI